MAKDLNQTLFHFKSKTQEIGIKHGQVKQLGYLLDNKKPNPRRRVVLEGVWAHRQAIAACMLFDVMFICPDLVRTPELIAVVAELAEKVESIYILSQKVFEKVSDRGQADGLISVAFQKQWEFGELEIPNNCSVVVLDGLEIPGNVGTIVRSSDGAGAAGVILCNCRVRLSHPKLLKSSQGSIFRVPLIDATTENTLNWLQKNSFKIILADTNAQIDFKQANLCGRIALVIGSERYGITKEWYEVNPQKVSVPMRGSCDSLNAAIAATLLLYEVCAQQLQNRLPMP